MLFTLRDYQAETARAVAIGFERPVKGEGPFQTQLAVLATGAGKCWALGTQMMLADGSIRPVEDLRPGDELLGPDSIPRTITSTNFGWGPLYRLTPHRHADPMTVNGDHILVLRVTNIGRRKLTLPDGTKARAGDTVEITVEDYLKASKTARHCLKWIQTTFDLTPYSEESSAIPPWLLGFWLADGGSYHAVFHKPGVTELLRREELPEGWEVKKMKTAPEKCETASIRGGFRRALIDENLLRNKHVPEWVTRGTREIRAEFLAGMIDGDGSAVKSGWEITQKSCSIIEAVALIARSLGWAVSLNEKHVEGERYYRVHLNGGPPLPLRRRENVDRRQIKNALVTGFEIEPLGGGRFAGVTIDGPDRRLLMPDSTVSHNTIVAVALSEFWRDSRNGRMLFLADTDELIDQAVAKYVDAAEIIPGVEKGQQRAPEGSPVVVASIQTLSKADRLARFDASRFTHVIADEAHLSMADSWQRVLGHFRGGGAKVLGITATPERGDGKSLGKFYENVAIEVGIFDLIERNYLSPVRVVTCPVEIDATEVDTSGEDFDPNDLAEVLEPYLESVIDEWERHCRDRKTLFFHPSIALSKKFAELLQRRGVQADHVDGGSPDRRERIQAYLDGRTQVMNNVQLLTKGFDCPDISCIVVLKPTRSRVQFQQMIGRGTRLADGKEDCIVLDFLWQFEELGVQRPASLLARSDEEAEFMQKRIDRQARDGDTTPLDLRETQSASEAEKINLLLDRFRSAVQGGRRAFDYRELGAMLYQPDLIEYEPQGGWELLPPTEKQREMLTKRGVSLRSIKSRGVASKVIEAIIERTDQGLATARQIRTLLGFDYDPEAAARLTFSEASEELDRLLGGNGGDRLKSRRHESQTTKQ